MSYTTVDQVIEHLEKFRGYYVQSISLEAKQDIEEETRVHISLRDNTPSVSHKISIRET
jgi:hypothetical protein